MRHKRHALNAFRGGCCRKIVNMRRYVCYSQQANQRNIAIGHIQEFMNHMHKHDIPGKPIGTP